MLLWQELLQPYTPLVSPPGSGGGHLVAGEQPSPDPDPIREGVVRVRINDTSCVVPTGDSVLNWLASLDVRVNGFCFKSGYDFGTGNILMLKTDLDSVITEGATNEIYITDGVQQVTIKNLLVIATKDFLPRETANSLVLVTLADSRFLSQKNQTLSNFDKFPPHPNYEEGGNDFAETWEEALDQYWDDVETSQTLSHTTTKYPSRLLRDVQTENTKGAYTTFNNILAVASHRLYYDGENFVIYNLGYQHTFNEGLVDDYTGRVIVARNDKAKASAFIPNTVRVKYRKRDGDMYNQKLVVDYDYDGTLDYGTMVKDINVYNIYDGTWDTQFNNTDHLAELTQLACEIAEAYFESFEQADRHNAIYFGVLGFAHAPDADYIEYYHDIYDSKYKTIVKSHDPRDHVFPMFDREMELLMEQFGVQKITTESDTTTEDPILSQSCGGDCYWEANANLSWVLLEDNCLESTTASTTATTASSEDPSPYDRCTTSQSTTATTASSQDPCECQEPDYCPDEDDECARTSCSRETSSNYNCGSTTTTTTQDPACTSQDPSCVGDCTWVGGPYGPIKLSGDCPTKSSPPICGCEEPTNLGPCDTETTDCEQTVFDPIPGGCGGSCKWMWYGISGVPYRWWLIDFGCYSKVSLCHCVYPSFDGEDDCEMTETSCGGQDDPCATTSTTADPTGCDQQCRWTATGDLTGWDLADDPCPASCPCIPPTNDPKKTCQVTFTQCSKDNTTSTTTTTRDPSIGACCWHTSLGEFFSCTDEAAVDCVDTGGLTAIYQGDGTRCTDDPCDDSVKYGVCCQFDGGSFVECFYTTESQCDWWDANDGSGDDFEYQGDGTECNGDCYVIGACCKYDLGTGLYVECETMQEADCNAITLYDTSWFGSSSCGSHTCIPTFTTVPEP